MFIKFFDNLQEKFYTDFTSFPIIPLGGNWDWALDNLPALSGKLASASQTNPRSVHKWRAGESRSRRLPPNRAGPPAKIPLRSMPAPTRY